VILQTQDDRTLLMLGQPLITSITITRRNQPSYSFWILHTSLERKDQIENGITFQSLGHKSHLQHKSHFYTTLNFEGSTLQSSLNFTKNKSISNDFGVEEAVNIQTILKTLILTLLKNKILILRTMQSCFVDFWNPNLNKLPDFWKPN